MKRRPLLLVAVLVTALLGARPAAADSVTVGASADAALFEFRPENNQGGMLDVPAGSLGGQNGAGARNRALFKFDLSAVPQEAVIDSVTLSLYVNVQPPDAVGSDYYVHRVLVGWGEGNKTGNQGQPASIGEVTWNSRAHEITPWFEPGGAPGTDYVATGSASQFINSVSFTAQWGSTAGMVADVQHWVDNPAQNFGWMLISDSEGTPYTAKRFATREYTTESLRPSLTVQYSVIPEPGTLALAAFGLAGWLAWRRR
jgi:PEP-CTERM motif